MTDLVKAVVAVVVLVLLFDAVIALGQEVEPLPEKYMLAGDGVCPIFVPEEEIWEARYHVVTNLSAPWDECTRYTFWSGQMELEPGVYDIPEYEGAFWWLWMIQPIYSCEWLAGPEVGGDCTRETHEAAGWTTPMWYVVCPSWDAFPPSRFGSVCLFDDGFESGDTGAWSSTVPPLVQSLIFSDGFETGDTSAWTKEVP